MTYSNQLPQTQSSTTWKKCSSCKKDINYGAPYYLCSVSTCRHKRTGYRFCSVPCWDAHLGYARHRDSFAEEAKAPTKEEWSAMEADAAPSAPREPTRKIVEPASTQNYTAATKSGLPTTDTLVVVSKVKQLIKQQADFNTSECCIDALTTKVVSECMKAIEKAKAAGRKTVMGRDIT